MKKLLVGLLMAALAFTGATAFAPTAVQAAPAKNTFCQAYPDQCQDTFVRTNAKRIVNRKANPRVRVNVGSVNPGNDDPIGTVRIRTRKPNGLFVITEFPFDGEAARYPIPGLGRPGVYRIRVRFIAEDGTIYRNSDKFFRIRVKAGYRG